jgi:pyruvate dehydrogenase E1 component alpha subunit
MAIAVKRAHEESRPTVVEINTYRHYGHSVSDAKAKVYRAEDEIERFKQHFDPIQLWRQRLTTEGVLTEETYQQIDREAKAEANAAADFADASPYPQVEDITRDVYFEVDEFTEAGRTGRHFFND